MTSRTRFPSAVLVLTLVTAVSLLPTWVFAAPELPRAFVDTTMPDMTGKTIAVAAGGDFQAALNSAQLGDTITLAAGATFTGPFTLPNKSGSGWIIVRTSAPDSALPPQGSRISPSFSKVMPKIVGGGSPHIAVLTTSGAHHFRFIGIEFAPKAGVFSSGLIRLEGSDHDITFDRCYIHGDPAVGGRRGIQLNSKATAIIGSYLSDWKEVGADSQAIGGWKGAGPFKIVNNYLEGAGENVMFGGTDPSTQNLVPSDIEIRRNHFSKPLPWRGSSWSIKNLLELKNARRVLIEGNLFEHNWPAAQDGYAIIFKSTNQGGGYGEWSVVEDVTFVNNAVRHVSSAIKIAQEQADKITARILIKNNVFTDVSSVNWGGKGDFMLMTSQSDSVVVEHNTALHNGSIIRTDGSHTNFVFRNNIVERIGGYGVKGSGVAEGTPTLDTMMPGYSFQGNVIVAGDSSQYPSNNFFPASESDVGFVDLASENLRLASSSPFKNAGTDGEDLGVDFDALKAAQVASSPPPKTDNDPPAPPNNVKIVP